MPRLGDAATPVGRCGAGYAAALAGVGAASSLPSAAVCRDVVALDVRGKALTDDIWPGVWARAEREADPPSNTWHGIPDGFRASDSHVARPVRVALALSAQGSDTGKSCD